jgi:hypothetical protein
MPTTDPASAVYKYLAVDDYLRDMLSTQAVSVALKTGLVDYLCEHSNVSLDELRSALDLEVAGFTMLVGLLQAAAVVQIKADSLALTDAFAQILEYRELIETKIHYANLVSPDVIHGFHKYITDMSGFMQDSGLFEMFDYGRCREITPENLQATSTWVRYTTLLTRYEALPYIENINLAAHTKLLDVGGNSGEFALQLCRANPRLTATVFDLPVVCNLGQQHLQKHPEQQRIQFLPGDLQRDELPTGYDLIVFKSFLHDWPSDQIEGFLTKAHAALCSGGVITIYERSRITDHANIAYGNLPLYLFHYFYREPSWYTDILTRSGFTGIEVKIIDLDTPFMLVSATRQ